tara:strand:+ start:4142 stop:4618 length:477 start_codon:yes stop_codon:yes gene_type:complete
MKAKTFENLIRKVVREEIDYALRREIKTLKEDLRDELKPTIVEHKERTVEVPSNSQQPISETAKNSLREKIMGSNPLPNRPIKKQNFVSDPSLNALLNETAAGDTNLEAIAPASVSRPFATGAPLPMDTAGMPEEVANAVTRDYSGLMKAINKKKGKV